MEKFVAILVGISLLLIHMPVNAQHEEGKVVITLYGMHGIKKIEKGLNEERAMELIKQLKGMNEKDAMHLLNKFGINVTNTLSFIFGFGNGMALYTADLAFFLLVYSLYGNALIAIILTAVFASITHLIPARIFQPVTLIGIKNGSITSIGLNGTKQMEQCMLFGFVGIIINVVIPNKTLPLFIAGYSIVVTTNPFS